MHRQSWRMTKSIAFHSSKGNGSFTLTFESSPSPDDITLECHEKIEEYEDLVYGVRLVDVGLE